MTPPRLILASASPRRKRLLAEAGINFEAIPSRVREVSAFRRPGLIVKELAYKKALSVAVKHPKRPVLGADTLVYCKGRVLGKPKTAKDAMRLLNLQNGSWQTVHTGVSLIWLEKKIFLAAGERTRCKARALPLKTLRCMAKKHLDKAGAYAVQDADDIFIAKMEGRFDTVVGLSMNLVMNFFKKAGLRRKCIK